MSSSPVNPAERATTALAIQAEGITKRFEGITALDHARLNVRAGHIHALVGENGAGKSTLVNILTGVYHPDSGRVLVGGQEVSFRSPRDALTTGISVVHQERNSVPKFSVAENVLLSHPPLRHGLLDRRQLRALAASWLEQVGLDVPLDTPVELLSTAQGQLLEIARALSANSAVLLLDEPTASIGGHEIDKLFLLLRELRERGCSIVFISHKLDEVAAVCDRITVLRDGRTILDDEPLGKFSQSELIEAMVGREVSVTAKGTETTRQVEPYLSLRDVATAYGHRGVNLEIRPGEIVGMYGWVGAGRTELAKSVLGLAKITAGQVFVKGKPARIRNPHNALQRYSIGYVSEDRKGEGLILMHPIRQNVGITIWDRLKKTAGYITPRREREFVGPVVQRIGVRATSLDELASALSGGNQQKVSVAKWLAAEVGLLVVDEPTTGVDVATKQAMYDLIADLAEGGTAVWLISSDLQDIVRLADRILVMSQNVLQAELHNTGDYDAVSRAVMEVLLRQAPGTASPDHAL